MGWDETNNNGYNEDVGPSFNHGICDFFCADDRMTHLAGFFTGLKPTGYPTGYPMDMHFPCSYGSNLC